jgi:hypothetical protein
VLRVTIARGRSGRQTSAPAGEGRYASPTPCPPMHPRSAVLSALACLAMRPAAGQAVAPEPGTGALVGAGLLAGGVVARPPRAFLAGPHV